MPMENQSSLLPEPFGNIPQTSAEFRTVPNSSEDIGKVPQAAERKENHTLTVRETARMFESAGVARTERSVINWCQPNRQGITRLDSYYDPNERKYYITPQSVEAVIQEEIQRTNKSNEPSASEPFGSPVAHVKHPHGNTRTTEHLRIQELENELLDLKIANEGKHQMIEFLRRERMEFTNKIQAVSRQVGQLEIQSGLISSKDELQPGS